MKLFTISGQLCIKAFPNILYFANPRLELACKNIRFSSLFAAGDFPREASPEAKSVASHVGVYRGHIKFCKQNTAMLIVLRKN